jgi:hydrogenase maturation protease
MSGHTLVAGIGNVFLSDDAFGVEVAHRLAGRSLPAGVRAEDYGIRGIHLAYELLEGYDTLLLIDAVPIGQPPGTLAVIEPEVDADGGYPEVDAHTMSPDVVLATLARLGGSVGRTVIVGCQPADLREGMGLSPAVAAVVDDAADLCLEVLAAVTADAPHAQSPQGGTSK